jgi:hypothetical protein
MKQVSNAIKSFVLSSPLYHLISQRKASSKYLFVLFLAGIAIGTSSFQKENLHTKSVPFKGKSTLSFDFANGLVTGTGTGSHIGRFTSVAMDDLSNFPEITSTGTFTAANGDEISFTQNGTAQDLGNGILHGDFNATITGGTGRFAGATGNFVNHVFVNENLATGSAEFEGTISY